MDMTREAFIKCAKAGILEFNVLSSELYPNEAGSSQRLARDKKKLIKQLEVVEGTLKAEWDDHGINSEEQKEADMLSSPEANDFIPVQQKTKEEWKKIVDNEKHKRKIEKKYLNKS